MNVGFLGNYKTSHYTTRSNFESSLRFISEDKPGSTTKKKVCRRYGVLSVPEISSALEVKDLPEEKIAKLAKSTSALSDG